VSAIVVTGLGVVSPLGCGARQVWERLIEGRSGIRRLPDGVVADVAAKIGGVVPTRAENPDAGFDANDLLTAKDQKRMDRFIQLALGAADEAIREAGWEPRTGRERERTATIIASGIGGIASMIHATRMTDKQGPRRLSPFTVPSFLVNLAAGQISIRFGFRGPIGAPVTACAASVQAIGDGARMIRAGEADIVVCGGAESCIDRVSLGSFAAAHALSTRFNDAPQQASRPFDVRRDGFVMSEGAAVVVIESLEHARARGARPLATVAGYGTSADGFHIAAAPDEGEGVQRAMRLAIASAGIAPSDVGYINAHATSTPMGDAAELKALAGVFGRGNGVSISSTKSATGHLLGAAGAVEAIFTILALESGILPPTLNLEEPDGAADSLDIVGPSARRKSIEHAMSNGFGFGGVNASILFRRMG
jgi:3-oxoacyl-[acyl-carrier-protein] synthase II